MEIPTRISVHPSCTLDVLDLLLPRIAALVHEEEPLPRCDEIPVTTTKPPDPGRSRSILYPCATRGRTGLYWRGTLCQTFYRTFHHSSRAPCYCSFIRRYDCPADVWDQHHRILLDKCVPGCRRRR